MGWEKDLYGSVYKSQSTKNAATKRKKTNDAKKQREADAYDRAFTSGVQSYASQNNMQYSDDLKAAAKAYYSNQDVRDDFMKKSVNESKSRNRAELKSYASFASKDENQSKIDEYNAAKKKMGMQPDNLVTQKKYDQMFGYDTKKGVDNGMFNRYQEYKTSKDYKVNHNDKTAQKGGLSFDKKVDKGLNALSDFFNKVKNSKAVDKVEELANTKVGKVYSKATEELLKHSPVGQQVENAKTLGKAALKGMDKVDQYTLSPMRNIANSNLNDLHELEKWQKEHPNEKLKTEKPSEAYKQIKEDVKGAYTGKRRDAMPNTLKEYGVSTGSKYGDKAFDFAAENVVDPTNLIGAGVAKTGLKALKGVSKLGKVAKTVEEASKVAKVAEDISNLPKNFEGKYLIKDEYPMQTKIELQRANEAIKKGDIQPNKVADTIENIKAAQDTALTDRQRNLQNIKLPNGKIEVQPTIKKSLTDLMGKNKQVAEIQPKETPVNTLPSQKIQESINNARQTGNLSDVIRNTDDLIKNIESNHVDDEELNLLKDEMNGIKLNLQTFAGTAEKMQELLSRVEKINKQTDTLLNSRKRAEEVKGLSIPEKKKYDASRAEADINHLQGKLDDLDYLEKSSVGGQLSPQVTELKANLEKRLESAKNKLNKANQPLTQTEEFKTRSQSIVDNLSEGFKNPGNFSLYRETPERNFDKIFPENAKEMKDTYLEPTKKAETERINFKNNINEQVKKMYKDLKISKKDDALIQEYGEGKISLDELKNRTDNWKNVEPAVQWYRNLYDQTLEQINGSLVRNDYNPIPKRKDYFPHYNKKGGLLKDIFGIDKTDHGLPTDINGLTDQFRPGKTYFTAAQRRTGDKTAYGALEGLSNYIEGASNLIYHTDNIKNIRSLEDAIRAKFGSSDAMDNVAAYFRNYGDQLAGKKGRLDRGAEELFGRTMYNTAKTLQSNIGKAMVGGNVNSALSGLIPVSTAAATTSKKALAQGLKDTIAAVVKDDGFKTPFMVRRMGADPLYMNKWEKASDKAFWMMKQVDNFATNFIVRSKYNELINKGLEHEAAVKGADNYAAKVMADRSKGQQPLLFNQRTLGPITQFQLEVNNQLSHIMKDIPEIAGENAKSRKGKILRTSAIYGQLALYGWLYNNLSQKVTGRRTAFDPIKYAQQFFEGNSIEGSKGILGQIPGTGMLVDGRTPVSATLPDVPGAIQRVQQSEGGLSDVLKEVGKAGLQGAPYLAGVPGYGQAKKSYEGIKATTKQGSYTDTGMLRYPIDVNPLKAAQLGIFGQYAPSEATKYFDEGRKPLSGKRTAKVDGAQDRQKAYVDVLIESTNAKIKRSKGNADKLKKLNADLKKLKQEKKQL